MDEKGLAEALESAAADRSEGDVHYRCLDMRSIADIARKRGASTREVSIAALKAGLLPLRYVKNIGTVGLEGQAKLLESRAVLVGAGGIGGSVAELLGRMGVGTVVIIDPDVFDETNLNRQTFACGAALGMPKVEVARDRLLDVNCDVEVITHRVAATQKNLADLVSGADVVIDALDSLDDRLLLQEACRDAGIVMVHGAIAGTSMQVTTIFPGDTGLEGFVPVPDEQGKAQGVEVETGNPATTPALAAAIEVQEAIKVILGTGTLLRGKMLYLDMADWDIEFIEL